MNEHILNWSQKRVLKQIVFLRKYGFYLAGGTALALHLGHRTSKDLDFYTKRSFNTPPVIQEFRNVFGKEVKSTRRAEDTLWLDIKNTDLSFFKYPYKLIQPLSTYATIDVASVEDIAAMKIEAILGRGKKRDFVDIYFLIKKYGLNKLLKFVKEKYPESVDEQSYLYALLYFKDAEAPQKDRSRIYLYKDIEWRDMRDYIEKEVKKYQLSLMKR
ncbi:nucleotidyl transferase AbiEii/AbiGii toxin family protein [Patescibacteria group bacterium AH-259-L07]|nr:nucleotidyl transferase AbiEii/AbiGii toxin family protein [Patescibacteria group bacterium AH-259-L07]